MVSLPEVVEPNVDHSGDEFQERKPLSVAGRASIRRQRLAGAFQEYGRKDIAWRSMPAFVPFGHDQALDAIAPA
jgi:hypothetical protein